MAKIKRVVNTYFWEDRKVQEKFTPEDKYFFLYLLTNPKTTQIGIYEFNIRYASLEMGYSEDTIRGLLDRFENVHKVIKRSGDEIAIKNFLLHSILKGGKPVEDCLRKELKQVRDKSLAMFVKDSVLAKDNINETVRKFLEELNFEKEELEKETDIKKKNTIDYQEIVDQYNKRCPKLPTLQKLTDKRKTSMRTFLKEYTFEEMIEVFDRANESDFLTSGTWSCNFDWVINKNNAAKILEGNYENKKKQSQVSNKIDWGSV